MGRPTQLEYFLSELCTELGFCGAIRDVERFAELESEGADAFTDAVLEAENLNPHVEKQLRREVHKRVSKYLGTSARRGAMAESRVGRHVGGPESLSAYAEPRPYSHEEAAAAFCSRDDQVVCNALVGVAFHDPDWRWVQSQCALLASHSSSAVRGLVATCLGHLARIHRQIDRDVVDPILESLAADRDPAVAGRVQDTLDDFDIFLRGPTNAGRRRGGNGA